MTYHFRGALLLVSIAAMAMAGPAVAGTGGAAPERTTIEKVCKGSPKWDCSADAVAEAGQEIRIDGKGLGPVKFVRFDGSRATAKDDVIARVVKRGATELQVRIPRRARSGRVTGLDSARKKLATGPALNVQRPSRRVAVANGKTYLFAGKELPALEPSSIGANAEVSVIRAADGTVVFSKSFTESPAQPVVWDGRDQAGKPATGAFHWRVKDASARIADFEPFNLLDHAFPIQGSHDYGTFINRFGGGRNHKGQDVMAACGLPLVAARGGKVEYSGYHSAAGNYVVIDGDGTSRDYVYMHMKSAPLVRTGDTVSTGEQLGLVGSTGRSSACHLHFELWSGPGWFTGGKALDPLAALKSWDAYPTT